MSDRPRLFVSHSSLDANLTRQVCDRLGPAPGNLGYDVLVDYSELKPGVDWPRHLHEYMAHCHAAVLLLTPNAVASAWVLKEATILAWRRSLDPSFKFFPVRFPDVDDAMLKKQQYGPLMLDLIQTIKSADPAEIANAVREQVGQPDPSASTPFDRLVGRLKDLLSQVGSETLRDIAEKMSIETPAWRPDVDPRIQYVTQVARRILSEDMGGFKGVHELIDALSFTPGPDNVKQIFRVVAPYWVDAQAAGRLPQLLTATQRRAAALNGARVSGFTALAYVRRAHPLSLLYSTIPIAGGGSGNLLSHVEEQLCTWMREKGREEGSDEEIIAALRDSEKTYYAVLPGPIDDESLGRILDRFPTITFILWTDEVLERDAMQTRVDWLEPMLDLDKEQRAYKSCKDAMKILQRMESSSF
jgi:hypothetical protein